MTSAYYDDESTVSLAESKARGILTSVAGKRLSFRDSVMLAAIPVGVAALLRLSKLELVEFRFDSAYWCLDALKIARGEALPLVGQQVGSVTVPLHNGPIFSYLLALVFWLMGPSPFFPVLLVALLGSAGVGICYWMGRNLYGESVGMVTAMLMACAPWAVLYGRVIWPQSLLPFTVPITFAALLHGVATRRTWLVASWGLLAGVSVQLHLSALALVPAGLLFLLIYSREVRFFVGALLGLVVGYAPVLAHDALNGWRNVGALAGLAGSRVVENESALVHLARYLWNLENVISGQGLWWSKLALRGSYLPLWAEWAQGLLMSGLFLIALLLVLHSLALRFTGRANGDAAGRSTRADVLGLLYVGIPLAYLLLSSGPILRHYYILVMPVAFLLMARGLQLARRGLRPWIWSGVAVGLVLNLATVGGMFAYLAETRVGWDHGTVLQDKTRAVEWMIQRSNGALNVDASRSREALAYYFLFRRALPVEFDESRGRIFTAESRDAGPAFVVVEPSFYRAPAELQDEPVMTIGGIRIVEKQMEGSARGPRAGGASR